MLNRDGSIEMIATPKPQDYLKEPIWVLGAWRTCRLPCHSELGRPDYGPPGEVEKFARVPQADALKEMDLHCPTVSAWYRQRGCGQDNAWFVFNEGSFRIISGVRTPEPA